MSIKIRFTFHYSKQTHLSSEANSLIYCRRPLRLTTALPLSLTSALWAGSGWKLGGRIRGWDMWSRNNTVVGKHVELQVDLVFVCHHLSSMMFTCCICHCHVCSLYLFSVHWVSLLTCPLTPQHYCLFGGFTQTEHSIRPSTLPPTISSCHTLSFSSDTAKSQHKDWRYHSRFVSSMSLQSHLFG